VLTELNVNAIYGSYLGLAKKKLNQRRNKTLASDYNYYIKKSTRQPQIAGK